MENNKKTNKKEQKKKAPDYPIILGEKKGKLIISSKLEQEINFLHADCGAKEWSGVLIYQIQKGDIDNPEELVIEAKGMFPMDIGTPGYTEYDFDQNNILEIHEAYPQILEQGWKEGHIHTHHNMRAYFSGTDEEELKDNTPNHAYYLSLIVNFEKKYVARLCVLGKRKVKGKSDVSFKNVVGTDTLSSIKLSVDQEVIYAIDLDIEIQSDSFFNQVFQLKKRQKEKLQKRSYSSSDFKGVNQQQSLFPAIDKVQKNKLDVNEINNFEYTEQHEYKDRIKDFLYKLISGDSDAQGHLLSLLMRMDHHWSEIEDEEKGEFWEAIESNLNPIYQECFPEDTQYDLFAINMHHVKEYLSEHSMAHIFADELLSFLDLYEVEKEEEEEDSLMFNYNINNVRSIN